MDRLWTVYGFDSIHRYGHCGRPPSPHVPDAVTAASSPMGLVWINIANTSRELDLSRGARIVLMLSMPALVVCVVLTALIVLIVLIGLTALIVLIVPTSTATSTSPQHGVRGVCVPGLRRHLGPFLAYFSAVYPPLPRCAACSTWY